jgi:hypothetical protein
MLGRRLIKHQSKRERFLEGERKDTAEAGKKEEAWRHKSASLTSLSYDTMHPTVFLFFLTPLSIPHSTPSPISEPLIIVPTLHINTNQYLQVLKFIFRHQQNDITAHCQHQ